MSRALSLADLAAESGVAIPILQRLAQIGAITPDASGSYSPGDVIRVDAVKSFLDAGIPLEKITEAVEHRLFTFEYLDRFHPEPAPPSTLTLDDLANAMGIPVGLLASVYLAMGLPEPPEGYRPTVEEAEILDAFADLWGRGGEETLLRAARLVGEPARALSEGWTRLYVEKITPEHTVGPMDDRIATIVDTTEKATNLAPAMFMWLLQNHLRRSIDRANIEGLEEVMSSHGLSFPLPAAVPAVAFVDISGYTSLTEREGDTAAAVIADTIRDRAQRTAAAHGGSLVKLLGDGAMLHFEDVQKSVEGVLTLVEALHRDGIRVHAGIHAGSMIERDGDYYGSTVNVASRIADVAGPGETLTTAAVVNRCPDARFVFEPMAPRALKGVDKEVDVFRVSSRLLDPS